MWDAIERFFQALVDFIYRIFLSIVDFFKDFFLWIIDSIFDIVIYLLEGMEDLTTALNPLEYINQIPDETRAIMTMVGFNECMVIITSALLIRLVLQLIPFTRLGS
jgi:hypothetical protein